jgi:hypothetical protein
LDFSFHSKTLTETEIGGCQSPSYGYLNHSLKESFSSVKLPDATGTARVSQFFDFFSLNIMITIQKGQLFYMYINNTETSQYRYFGTRKVRFYRYREEILARNKDFHGFGPE